MADKVLTARGTDFRYRAARRDGSLESGSLTAPSQEAAAATLLDRGLFLIELGAHHELASTTKRIPADDLALGLRVLGDLLDSGLPAARSLAALQELAPTSWASTLVSVQSAIREGQGLGAAFATIPGAIPPLVIGIIQAGEAGSGLALAVRRAADVTEAAAATRAAIRGALAYPLILALAGTAAIGLLVGVVLPRFAAILEGLGEQLPPSTRFLLASAQFARGAFVPGLVGATVFIVVWRAWTSTAQGRRRWHELLLSLPVAGTARRAAATARVTAALATLLDNGVPVARAMQFAAAAAGDAALAHRLHGAREAIVQGGRISRALADHDAVTPTVVRLARAGEESGRLGAMLAHASRLERERAAEMTRAAVRMLEPALVLLFGALVALVAASLLQAVYSVRPPA